MQNFSKLTARACALSSALCIPAVSFGAANLDVTVGADLELHDNAALTSSDKKSDLDRVARARVDFNDPDGALLTKLGYTIERHDYLRDIEPDRTVLDGASQLTWLALPRLLDFTISHQVSDQLKRVQQYPIVGRLGDGNMEINVGIHELPLVTVRCFCHKCQIAADFLQVVIG